MKTCPPTWEIDLRYLRGLTKTFPYFLSLDIGYYIFLSVFTNNIDIDIIIIITYIRQTCVDYFYYLHM